MILFNGKRGDKTNQMYLPLWYNLMFLFSERGKHDALCLPTCDMGTDVLLFHRSETLHFSDSISPENIHYTLLKIPLLFAISLSFKSCFLFCFVLLFLFLLETKSHVFQAGLTLYVQQGLPQPSDLCIHRPVLGLQARAATPSLSSARDQTQDLKHATWTHRQPRYTPNSRALGLAFQCLFSLPKKKKSWASRKKLNFPLWWRYSKFHN